MSGLVADSRTLVDHARVECANHWFVYNENMKVESVAQAVSNRAIRFGDSDEDGPAMVTITVMFYSLSSFSKLCSSPVSPITHSFLPNI